MRGRKTVVWSIFGEVENVVARSMIAEGKLNQLPLTGIPEQHRFDERGRPLLIAVVVPGELSCEFERRIKELQAP